MPDSDPAAPPRTPVVIAAALALALAVTVAVIGLTSDDTGTPSADSAPRPLPLPAVEAPESGSGECKALMRNLPDGLPSAGDTLTRRELAEPAPPATAAWGAVDPVILRCGLHRPADLTKTSRLRVVNEVQWLPVEGEGSSTWYAVDREVYVALTMSDNAGTGPLQEISDVIADSLKAVPVDP